MPSNFLSNTPFNPLMLPWTDLGLRTLETMVATGQQMSEQVDRMTRATAAEPTEELVEEVEETAQPIAASALAALGQMQAASFQWAMQAWQQWFSTFARFNPLQLTQSDSEAEPVQPSLFNALVSPMAKLEPPAKPRARAARQTAELEHAVADAGKRRRSSPRKPRASNNRPSRSK
jgi:hypothetical protein